MDTNQLEGMLASADGHANYRPALLIIPHNKNGGRRFHGSSENIQLTHRSRYYMVRILDFEDYFRPIR